jgi:hypothetical protein
MPYSAGASKTKFTHRQFPAQNFSTKFFEIALVLGPSPQLRRNALPGSIGLLLRPKKHASPLGPALISTFNIAS